MRTPEDNPQRLGAHERTETYDEPNRTGSLKTLDQHRYAVRSLASCTSPQAEPSISSTVLPKTRNKRTMTEASVGNALRHLSHRHSPQYVLRQHECRTRREQTQVFLRVSTNHECNRTEPSTEPCGTALFIKSERSGTYHMHTWFCEEPTRNS
jgi:hypothetical protein